MKNAIRVLAALALAILFAVPVYAAPEVQDQAGVAFDLSGYYRVRYDNIFKVGWRFNQEFRNGTENQDSDWWSYFDQRALFLPVIRINENVTLKGQIDALRNITFGDNNEAIIPQVNVERNPADVQQIETIKFDSAKLNTGNIFSSITSSNQGPYGAGQPGDKVNTVDISRLWAEATLPFGFFRFGRMGSDFGMGVFSNSGLPKKTPFGWEGLDKNYGDTYDRLMFGTRIGKVYIPVLIYDRIMEGDFKTGAQDVHQFVFVQYLRDVKLGEKSLFNGGLYLMHRSQHSTDAKVFAYDLWLKLEAGGFSLENEAVALQGSLTMMSRDTIQELEDSGLPTGEGGGKIDVSAYLDAFRANYKTKKWGAGVEYGFSSPSDPNPEREFDPAAAAAIAVAAKQKDADKNSPQSSIDFINTVVENQAAFGKKVYTFAFDPDYQMDMIIWKLLMGGAVQNGMFAKATGYVQPVEEFRIQADVIKSYVNESYKGLDGRSASHDLGWEVDLDFSGNFYDHFFTGLQFGYAIVGPYFKDNYENAQNIFTMKMRTGVTF